MSLRTTCMMSEYKSYQMTECTICITGRRKRTADPDHQRQASQRRQRGGHPRWEGGRGDFSGEELKLKPLDCVHFIFLTPDMCKSGHSWARDFTPIQTKHLFKKIIIFLKCGCSSIKEQHWRKWMISKKWWVFEVTEGLSVPYIFEKCFNDYAVKRDGISKWLFSWQG